MTTLYDLHCHSTASDGALSPRDVLTRAKDRGVDVLALTDHDVTDGLLEAKHAADELGIDLLPGVEISVTWKGQTIHILGLNIDPENQDLQQGLVELRKFREQRGEEIARRLAKHGIEDALLGAKKFASGAILSRTHFAHFLVKAGLAKDIRAVFKHFLVQNKPGFVAGKWASLDQAVSWIRGAGGQSIIAHPARYKLSATKLRQLFSDFKDCGGDALEVASSSHSNNECNTMARYATQFGLLASQGSDYHGPAHHWVELGKIPPLPTECIPIWSVWPAPQKVL
jgi:predicted metal-dependent phosphoesterase TrpH